MTSLKEDNPPYTRIVLETLCGCKSPYIVMRKQWFLPRVHIPLLPHPEILGMPLDYNADYAEGISTIGCREFTYSGQEERDFDEHGNKRITLLYKEVYERPKENSPKGKRRNRNKPSKV